jgi:hypothetical protein
MLKVIISWVDHAVKPHKVRYYLEKRDPEFEPKMAEIWCAYRQVAVLREQGQSAASTGEGMDGSLAIISFDENPASRRSLRQRRIFRPCLVAARP